MANVLNRITGEYIESANTPEYDPAVWIINPDLSAVVGRPTAFWIINADDSVSLASPAQQADIIRMAPYKGRTLDEVKLMRKNDVNSARDRHLNGGWVYQGVLFDSDSVSRQNMNGTMTLLGTGYVLPSDFKWRALDNEDHPFDNASFTLMYQCSCIWVEMIFETSWYHKGQIDALTDIASVISYNVDVGWPAGYTPA